MLKKSILSKFFIMNLLILIIIVVCQLLFQALYFESYYLDKKKDLLDNNINEFEKFLVKGPNKIEIIEYIENIMRKDNIALSFTDKDFSSRVGLENYMGSRRVIVMGTNNNKYNVIIGDQFAITNIKSNVHIRVVGSADQYGNIIADSIFISGKKLDSYYEIIQNEEYNGSNIVMPTYLYPAIDVNKKVIIDGYIEEFIKQDNTYIALSSADMYISEEDKLNIVNNDTYNSKINNNITIDDIMYSSKNVGDGYILAVTALGEVNEVIGTMNSYYILIFFILLILVVIISFIYSKFMTKPLVEMSKIAKRISECDFQYKYNVTREDEIGILGNSLNLISDNLEVSLSQLKNTNGKLKEEMDTQKFQEEKRKELIANISHELKTPITIIQGRVNGIKSGMYSVDMLDDLLEETSKMNDLVKEMLEVSKLESPTFKLNKGTFDLYNIILKEQDKLKSMINDKSLEVKIYGEDEAIVFGDEKRINQVITNLFTNAIKYTAENNKIEIYLEYIMEEDVYLFKIKNYGVTLSKDHIEKIWDSFYRAERSRNKKFGGSGLGLAIVKRILELHKSHYGVRSNDDYVEFYFTIKKCMGY